ncbi:sulfate/molybdate ABC transporter ATP-binding protein [Marinobacter zhanjiangensis]|uniref:Sulfate/thiosulfate import ATP-binding protein CysA n=1 Tax=Marinobacter zhanjiangensis TaxID=578215 RepID=A0ABQ3B2I2_9GAMM|nr:TOBE-like domain-containing protein [Marinobacter zhanjiangensis]GGY74885.1 sulfate/thiosulfate import ATP-binding protein CysA [Marinobacter zhanjiangensis]
MSIEIQGINKFFDRFQALNDINLTIPDGQLTALLGPSGSGKTTLLRIIAGLESAEQGRILFSGRDVTGLHVRDRSVGFVFQHYALFRHMTVAQNVAFGLDVLPRRERPGKPEIRQRVNGLLEMVQLDHLANRYPAQLSGGQKQRIALARAMAMRPEILLLDEPFGALDAKVRKELRRWLRSLHDELHFTSVFVTHDQEEALELSDQVVVMSNGSVEQVDSPLELYARPDSRFVFDFLGQVNVLSGTIGNGIIRQGDAWVKLPRGCDDDDGQLYLRPHEVRLTQQPTREAHLPFRIEAISVIGAEVRIELKPDGWECDELWEVGISHSDFNARKPQRGDRCYAVPEVGHLFCEHLDEPKTLNWH